MILLWFVLSLTVTTGLLTGFVLWTRYFARRCIKVNLVNNGDLALSSPRQWTHERPCACYYVAEDELAVPRGKSYWVNGASCEEYCLKHGFWPEYCRGSRK